MGCGSSSTAVQTFKNPQENKNYQRQKAESRQSSAAPSIKSQRSEKKEKPSRKSSASSRASVASTDSTRRRKAGERSGANSASTRKTYTIPRPNSEVVTPVESHEDHEYKQETDVVNFEPVTEIDEKKLEAQRHHEEIQKQTFLTGDPDHEVHNENVTENHYKYKAESHEEIAKRKEEKRSQLNYEDLEEETINSLNPVPLSFPPDMGEAVEVNAEYTIDDIVEHNNEVSGLDWFKYGKKIYSWKKMEPIIKDRLNQFKDPDSMSYDQSCLEFPIFKAREHKVSRKELARVLSFCHVGNSIEIPREQKLSRMKQSAENVLEEESDSEYIRDYKNQLNRWLADYPMNKIANDPPDTKVDPNELPFPLPADIKSDPSVLREWSEAWEAFDLQVPEEGAWVMAETSNENLGDTHELFSNAVKECHGIEALEPFEMTIDGDVAWVVIELDLFKNDQTTEHQDTVWKSRATRTNINDPVWMKKRRDELGDTLKKRYEKRQINYPVENFITFAEILEQHWEEFQNLCAKEFSPPVRKERQTADIKPVNENISHVEEKSAADYKDGADNVLVLCNDRDDDRRSETSQIKEDRSVNAHDNNVENRLELELTDKGNAENNIRSESRGSYDSTCKIDTPRGDVRSGGSSSSSNRGSSSDNKERAASRESNRSTKSSRSSSKRDSPENIIRTGSRGSDRSSVKGDNTAYSVRSGSRRSSCSSNKGGSEQGPNTEDKGGFSTENSERLEEDINNANEDQDQMPALETNDSGLDLISNDQLDVGNADNEKKDGDSLQMPDKQESDVGPNNNKKETDDFFD